MTEAEWRASTDPWELSMFLYGKVGDRKSRLLVCGALRLNTRLMAEPWAMTYAEAAERHADGLNVGEELLALVPDPYAASWVWPDRFVPWWHLVSVWAPDSTTGDDASDGHPTADDEARSDAVWRGCCGLARCLIGHPFRPQPKRTLYDRLASVGERAVRLIGGGPLYLPPDDPAPALYAVTPDPAWLTSTVAAIAQGIYAERAFELLPVLADALEDAGCEDAEVLAHCRGPGPHARGCWVIDMVLGRS